jgi:hypothetical protein
MRCHAGQLCGDRVKATIELCFSAGAPCGGSEAAVCNSEDVGHCGVREPRFLLFDTFDSASDGGSVEKL